ncbi:MAG: hypothetical protein JW731_06155 [Bacteroidales bacterium]|nr:hypothetical protein [Bacteroidales bacterium]
MQIIGLIPAAGQAHRITPLPCSKELYPVAIRRNDQDQSLRTKVVSHFLLEKMKLANVHNAFIIIRKGKWDIPAYYLDGKIADMHLAYLLMDLPYGVPFSIDQAFPFILHANVVFGFPDIIFQPDDAFQKLIERQSETFADIILGVFPAADSQFADRIEVAPNANVKTIHKKTLKSHLKHTWLIAYWTPKFTQFMHDHLQDIKNGFPRSDTGHAEKPLIPELSIGEVIQAAINHSLNVQSVHFLNGKWLDIGIPENLSKIHRPDFF